MITDDIKTSISSNHENLVTWTVGLLYHYGLNLCSVSIFQIAISYYILAINQKLQCKIRRHALIFKINRFKWNLNMIQQCMRTLGIVYSNHLYLFWKHLILFSMNYIYIFIYCLNGIPWNTLNIRTKSTWNSRPVYGTLISFLKKYVHT